MRAAGLGDAPARGVHPHPASRAASASSPTIRRPAPTPSVVIIVKPHVDPPRRRRIERGVNVALVGDRPQPSRVGESAHQVEQPAEQRAGDAGGASSAAPFEGVMRNYRGELAECTQSNLFIVQGRRGADAAARRRPAAGHHARVPVRGRRASSACRCARQVLRDDDLFGADEAFLTSTTREVVPDRAGRRPARSATGVPGPDHAGAARGVPRAG